MIREIIKLWRSLRYYVIADPSDNSITLSRHVFSHMLKSYGKIRAQVFVFRIPQTGSFGFIVNPEIGMETQICHVQYNSKYKCIGFETLCPSVGKILYDYGLPALDKCKLSISVMSTADGKTYYQIERPRKNNEKSVRKHKKNRYNLL